MTLSSTDVLGQISSHHEGCIWLKGLHPSILISLSSLGGFYISFHKLTLCFKKKPSGLYSFTVPSTVFLYVTLTFRGKGSYFGLRYKFLFKWIFICCVCFVLTGDSRGLLRAA